VELHKLNTVIFETRVQFLDFYSLFLLIIWMMTVRVKDMLKFAEDVKLIGRTETIHLTPYPVPNGILFNWVLDKSVANEI